MIWRQKATQQGKALEIWARFALSVIDRVESEGPFREPLEEFKKRLDAACPFSQSEKPQLRVWREVSRSAIARKTGVPCETMKRQTKRKADPNQMEIGI